MAPHDLAVIFDLGGVVLDWRPLDLDRGTLSHAQAVPRFAARTGRDEAEMARRLLAVRDSLQPIAGTVALMRELSEAGVPLYCLSNMHAELAAWLQRTHDFWPVFRGVVISADEKLIKPDPEIFRRLLQRHGLSATRS
jgi:HAD superfamily hydrolase (TIGR01509 family)